MAITLTPSAATHIENILKRHPHAVGLRFGVKSSGCAEYRYVIDVANQVEAQDCIFESQGIKIVVNQAALEKIDNTEIDYQKQGINSTIIFKNPQAENACGCGESFSLKSN